MTTKQVLIISNPQDEHTIYVSKAVQELGATPILFYPEQLGTNSFLVLDQSTNRHTLNIILPETQGVVDVNDIYSIWYRRPQPISLESKTTSIEELEFSRDEWRAALESTYALTNKPIWVSHPDKLKKAARKSVQLQIAHQLGLKIPRTLITNEPNKAKEFYQLCNGKVIVKATGSGWVYSQDEEDIYFVMTNRPNHTDIEATNEISVAPVTFQEEIPKAYEIRVNIVGQQVLAIQIDSQNSSISELDWRRYDVKNTPYSPYHLPSDIKNKCLKLTQLFGLEFGAIDLICQPDGEYVFLEINGNGQFLWAEELSGVKVSKALASLLSGVTSPLKFANL